MNKQEFRVFFKVESDKHQATEMKEFGEKCIKQISVFSKIINVNMQPKAVTFVVSFVRYIDADEFIHRNCYMQYDDSLRTIAFWNGTKPNYEVFISNGPKGMTRRDLFLAMERFGAIGKATTSGRTEGAGWVSFVNQKSYRIALNSDVYVRGVKVNVSMTEGNTDRIPFETQKKTISFRKLGQENDYSRTNTVSPRSQRVM